MSKYKRKRNLTNLKKVKDRLGLLEKGTEAQKPKKPEFQSSPGALLKSMSVVFNKTPAQREERERISRILRAAGWWQAADIVDALEDTKE